MVGEPVPGASGAEGGTSSSTPPANEVSRNSPFLETYNIQTPGTRQMIETQFRSLSNWKQRGINEVVSQDLGSMLEQAKVSGELPGKLDEYYDVILDAIRGGGDKKLIPDSLLLLKTTAPGLKQDIISSLERNKGKLINSALLTEAEVNNIASQLNPPEPTSDEVKAQ